MREGEGEGECRVRVRVGLTRRATKTGQPAVHPLLEQYLGLGLGLG